MVIQLLFVILRGRELIDLRHCSLPYMLVLNPDCLLCMTPNTPTPTRPLQGGGLKPCLKAWEPCGLFEARKGLHKLREGFIPNGCCGVEAE
jgi:hypothetical protein